MNAFCLIFFILFIPIGRFILYALLLIGFPIFLYWCKKRMFHFDVKHPMKSFLDFSGKCLHSSCRFYYLYLLIFLPYLIISCFLDLADPYYYCEYGSQEITQQQIMEEMPEAAMTAQDREFLYGLYGQVLMLTDDEPGSAGMNTIEYDVGSEESFRLIDGYSSRPSELCRVWVTKYSDGVTVEADVSFYDPVTYDGDNDIPIAAFRVRGSADKNEGPSSADADALPDILRKKVYRYGNVIGSHGRYSFRRSGISPYGAAWECWSSIFEKDGTVTYTKDVQTLEHHWFYRPLFLYFNDMISMP